MLFRYLKNYRFRLGLMAASLLILVFSLSFSILLLSKNIIKGSSIDESYSNVNLNYGYELNYSTGTKKEIIYPDTDIAFFVDSDREERIVATSIMNKYIRQSIEGFQFDLSILESDKQAIIPQNIAINYNLKIGDTIFCEHSYTSELKKLEVVDICDYIYDFNDKSILNDVGIIAIGYDREFEENTKCKYLILSTQSETDLIAQYPQILKRTFNFSNFLIQANQIMITPILVLDIINIINFLIYIIFVGNRTIYDLKKLKRLGVKKNRIFTFSLLEFVLMYFLPSFIIINILKFILNINGYIYELSMLISLIVLIFLYCFILLYKLYGGRVYEITRD